MVPHPVMLGFVIGLAIVIFLAQLGQLETSGESDEVVWPRRNHSQSSQSTARSALHASSPAPTACSSSEETEP